MQGVAGYPARRVRRKKGYDLAESPGYHLQSLLSQSPKTRGRSRFWFEIRALSWLELVYTARVQRLQ